MLFFYLLNPLISSSAFQLLKKIKSLPESEREIFPDINIHGEEKKIIHHLHFIHFGICTSYVTAIPEVKKTSPNVENLYLPVFFVYTRETISVLIFKKIKILFTGIQPLPF